MSAQFGQDYPRIVRRYYSAKARFTRVVIGLRACFVGFWLGVIPQRELHLVDERYYNGEAMYVDREYNRSGLFEWERRVLAGHFPGERDLLLLSAGGGREVLALRRMGHRVDAYECNPSFVSFANAFLCDEGLEAAVRLAPRDTCPAGPRRYEGAIVGWGGYMLIHGRERRVALLRSIRAQLEPGAPLLLSFFTRPGDQPYYRVIALLGSALRAALGRERVEVGDDLDPNYVHHFTQGEIERELRAAGFRPAFFSRDEYGHAVGIAE